MGTEVRVALHGRRVGGWVVARGVEPPPGVRLQPLAKVRGHGPAPELVELATSGHARWAGRPAQFLRTRGPPPRSTPSTGAPRDRFRRWWSGSPGRGAGRRRPRPARVGRATAPGRRPLRLPGHGGGSGPPRGGPCVLSLALGLDGRTFEPRPVGAGGVPLDRCCPTLGRAAPTHRPAGGARRRRPPGQCRQQRVGPSGWWWLRGGGCPGGGLGPGPRPHARGGRRRAR